MPSSEPDPRNADRGRTRGAAPGDFRRQVLQRLRNRAQAERVAAQRLQQRVAFERLLARLDTDGTWVLKGGFALELRYGWTSRPTRDIDLRLAEPPPGIDPGQALRGAVAHGQAHQTDGFVFDFGEAAQEMAGAPGGTARLAVTARLAGAVFAQFHVDLSCGDALVGLPDALAGSDLLAFAGIAPIRFPVYPVAQHLAEKLHAYTLPRDQDNTRVKDLVDLVAVAAADTVDGAALLDAVEATFAARATHPVPNDVPAPPAAWRQPYARLAGEWAGAPTTDLDEAVQRARAFWVPVLRLAVAGLAWRPAQQAWQER